VKFQTITLPDFCANSTIFHPSNHKKWEFDKTLSMSKTDREPLKVKEKKKNCAKSSIIFPSFLSQILFLFLSSFLYSLFHISFFSYRPSAA
jgi:hypothetical protein